MAVSCSSLLNPPGLRQSPGGTEERRVPCSDLTNVPLLSQMARSPAVGISVTAMSQRTCSGLYQKPNPAVWEISAIYGSPKRLLTILAVFNWGHFCPIWGAYRPVGKPAVVTVSGNPLVIDSVESRNARGPVLGWTVKPTLWGRGLLWRDTKKGLLPSPAPSSPMLKLSKWEPKGVPCEQMPCGAVVWPGEHRQL